MGTLCLVQRYHPNMRRLSIRLEINIDGRKQHPLPIRRHLRFLNALKRHHVFESKRMFALSDERKRGYQNRQGEKASAHHDLRVKNETASLIQPGIYQLQAASLKIRRVARGKRSVVHQSYSRNLSVQFGYWSALSASFGSNC